MHHLLILGDDLNNLEFRCVFVSRLLQYSNIEGNCKKH
jgi:hypothetical protein